MRKILRQLLKWWLGTKRHFINTYCRHDWYPNRLGWGDRPHRMCKICSLQQTQNKYNQLWQDWSAGYKREEGEGHAIPEYHFFWKDCVDENGVIYKTRAKTEVEDRY